MKKYYLALCFFTLIPFFLFAQPRIEIVGGDTYDWGTVKPNQDPLRAKVKIKNVGNEVLKILEVKPGCGCTTAPLDKTELQPGEEATLDVTLRIAGFSNEVTKSVRIASNDPDNPNKYLFLKTKIYHPILVQPTAYFTFTQMTVGKESVASVTLKNNTNENITFSDIQFEPENLSINLPRTLTLKAGETFQITAKIVPDKKGYFNCFVRMKTSHPDMKELVIPGYGQVQESPLFNN
ncbi:MAG: DUF1573 domain-containing protein [Ignavibacteria bacterium]|nr:DUF1573 domain-containing protein [Ignavibacteria bacterium]